MKKDDYKCFYCEKTGQKQTMEHHLEMIINREWQLCYLGQSQNNAVHLRAYNRSAWTTHVEIKVAENRFIVTNTRCDPDKDKDYTN